MADNRYVMINSTGNFGSSGTSGAAGSSGTSGVGGGSVDLSTDDIKYTGTAGETLVVGDVCYYKSDSKFWKANASAEATTKGFLLMANSGITADASGEFLRMGKMTTTGIVAGTEYYLSTTTGEYTDTKPILSGEFVRIIGYGLTTTILMFDPSQDYIELL